MHTSGASNTLLAGLADTRGQYFLMFCWHHKENVMEWRLLMVNSCPTSLERHVKIFWEFRSCLRVPMKLDTLALIHRPYT